METCFGQRYLSDASVSKEHSGCVCLEARACGFESGLRVWCAPKKDTATEKTNKKPDRESPKPYHYIIYIYLSLSLSWVFWGPLF